MFWTDEKRAGTIVTMPKKHCRRIVLPFLLWTHSETKYVDLRVTAFVEIHFSKSCKMSQLLQSQKQIVTFLSLTKYNIHPALKKGQYLNHFWAT